MEGGLRWVKMDQNDSTYSILVEWKLRIILLFKLTELKAVIRLIPSSMMILTILEAVQGVA